MSENINKIENEIDLFFENNKLKEKGFAQAAWTLLSVNEDRFLFAIHNYSENEIDIFADQHINCLTYPLRFLKKENFSNLKKFCRELINDDYQFATDWIESALSYDLYSTIFPLYHRNFVNISVEENKLIPIENWNSDKDYEAYNRLVQREAKNKLLSFSLDPDFFEFIFSKTKYGRNWFKINFDQKIIHYLTSNVYSIFDIKFSLPEDWHLGDFTFQEYKNIIITIQSMLYAWFQVRISLVNNGLEELGYKSSVYVVKIETLIKLLVKHSNYNPEKVEKILNLVTFGSNGINDPDIANQPLIDLKNGHYALSPFLWLNGNTERNLCVLLNKIPRYRNLYLSFVNEKEELQKEDIQNFLTSKGFFIIKSQQLENTDLDIAIIDHNNKSCLCLELKWFIEPAEVREIVDKTEELKKGIDQGKIIFELFKNKDPHFINNILKIDFDYNFLVAVASQNWIGFSDFQDNEIPIIKLWDLLYKIEELKSLLKVNKWLAKKEYLPKKGIDYEIHYRDIPFGKWTTTWYGIKPLIPLRG